MGFALLALVLGAIGLFGVIAHDAASRRAELAFRIALGADPIRILSATLGQGAGDRVWRWEASCRSGQRARSAAWDSRRIVWSLERQRACADADHCWCPRCPSCGGRAARTDPLIALRSE